MTGELTLPIVGAIAFCVAVETARETCFKHGAAASVTAALAKPVIWVGVACWAIELISWTFVLGQVALAVAFPLMASSYATIALAGAFLFKETINLRHAFGLFLVVVGVICVGATGL